ncbi:hypothetical protein COV18_05515 [Candidatus Woesearchaeota archaeon CG10_big_fil_rev_8_21_14_0_10_37_12]|nr:MAG: hypothetical protein COV18_05515 [Candidatus Woesearchaeota archaeon CG10_big_fil_rev_8_21_14_0_10_37_12]
MAKKKTKTNSKRVNKVAVRKINVKKQTKEKSSFLQNVVPENCFWCRDGQILKNLSELSRALKKMSDETFKHHVNKEKNDFATWIDEIVEDHQLVNKLRKHNTKSAMQSAIRSRIENLKK